MGGGRWGRHCPKGRGDAGGAIAPVASAAVRFGSGWTRGVGRGAGRRSGRTMEERERRGRGGRGRGRGWAALGALLQGLNAVGAGVGGGGVFGGRAAPIPGRRLGAVQRSWIHDRLLNDGLEVEPPFEEILLGAPGGMPGEVAPTPGSFARSPVAEDRPPPQLPDPGLINWASPETGASDFQFPLLNETAPWLAGAIEVALALRQSVWPILIDRDYWERANITWDGDDGVTFGGQIWASIFSAALFNISLWPTTGDGFMGFGLRIPYLTLGGGGRSYDFINGGVVTARPFYLTFLGALFGPLIGGSANVSPVGVRLFRSFGWDQLGVQAPEYTPPLVPLGWLGGSVVRIDVLGGSFLAALESALGSLA